MSSTARPSKVVPRRGDEKPTGRRSAGVLRSNALRDSAKGEACTFNIAGCCNYDSATTVLCHLPDESHGTSLKAHDIASAYGCSACHDAIDGRSKHHFAPGEQDFYMRRAMVRTMRRFIELGLVRVAA